MVFTQTPKDSRLLFELGLFPLRIDIELLDSILSASLLILTLQNNVEALTILFTFSQLENCALHPTKVRPECL